MDARGFTAGQKNCGKSGLGRRASVLAAAGPPGLRGRRRPWAAGPWGRHGPAFSNTLF